MNFDFITSRLAVGTTPEGPADMGALIGTGITHIINCRSELDIGSFVPSSIAYLWDGTEDWIPGANQHKGLAWFLQGLEFALPALLEPRRKLYVFCHVGANRSATLAWTILRALGISTIDCFAIVDTHRLIDIPGLLECGWWRDGEAALKTLGYL
jgi:hypothetical protein